MRVWSVLALLLVAAAPALAETDCSPAGVNAARREFRTFYQAKDYARARNILGPFEDCFGGDPQGTLAAAVLSDLAIAAYHAGDSETCAETLVPYAPDAKGSEARLAELPEKVRRGVLFNLRLCTGGCPMVAPNCQSIAAALALQKRAKGRFAAPACPFPAGDNAVAVPNARNSCLTILPPRAEVSWSERAEADPEAVCPRLALVRSDRGAVRTSELPLPKGSWLRDLEICCVKPILGVAKDGSFAVEPEDNPPEGCLSGHRTYVVEEVYALDRGRLRLKHKVREGVY